MDTQRDRRILKATVLPASLAICCAICLWPSGRLFAQAGPGPLHPAQTDVPPQKAPPPKKAPAVEPRKTLAGYWKLNSDESDDARIKLEDAWGSGGGMGGGGGRRTGIGYPFPVPGGGNGPYGGGGGRGSGGEERQQMQDTIRSADSLDIALKEAEVDLTTDRDRKLVLYTDGRKIQKSKDETVEEISARWNGAELVSDEKSPRGRKMSRTFELSPDGTQMTETWRVEFGRSDSPMVIRYVYDAARRDQP